MNSSLKRNEATISALQGHGVKCPSLLHLQG